MHETTRRSSHARALAVALACLGAGCDAGRDRPDASTSVPPSGDGGLVIDLDEPLDAGGLPYDCRIGVSSGGSDPVFAPLAPGGEIPIGGVGQAGLTARLAFRCSVRGGDDPKLADAEAELVLTNAFTGVTAPREPRPQTIAASCDAGSCDFVPVLIEISHLAKLTELEGLKVRADLRVLADDVVLGQDRTHGVFSPIR